MAQYLDKDGLLYFWSKLKERFAAIGSAFTPKGSKEGVIDLPSLVAVDTKVGDVYNMSDAFTITSDFVEYATIGAKEYPAGTNVVCVDSNGTKKWDVLSGFVNLEGYATTGHNHDSRYYTETEVDTKLGGKSDTTHNHDHVYSKLGHTHSDYVTSEYLGQNYVTSIDAYEDFASANHNHDDRYYTESEMNTKLNGKSNTDHNHDGVYVKPAVLNDYLTHEDANMNYAPSSHTHDNATASKAGLIKVSSVNSTDVGVNSESTTTGRYYSVELNNNGVAVVNVPWKDTTYGVATTGANGLMSTTQVTKLNGIATGATADSAITNSEIDTILAS